MPGGYAFQWADLYRKYVMFSGGKLLALAVKLEDELTALEDYYTLVRQYIRADRKAKPYPNDATLQQELKTAKSKITNRDAREQFEKAAKVALKGIADVCEAVTAYLDSMESKMTEGDESVYMELYRQMAILSNEISKDYKAYVKDTLVALFALSTVGGAEYMPSLPPTPGGNSSNTSG